VAIVPIKPATAQSAAHLPATTAVRRVTSLASATPRKRRSPATAAVRSDTSHVNAQTQVLAAEAEVKVREWAAATLAEVVEEAEEAVKNATNVAKLDVRCD